MNRTTRPRRGFTLIEVLAAMLLIAIVIPVAMSAANTALRSAASTRHRHEASLLAETKLAEALAFRDASLVGTNGLFEAPWDEYRWELVSAQADYGCANVTAIVYWNERGAERSYEMTTLIYTTGIVEAPE